MHIPVLLNETLDYLDLNNKKLIIDWTLWLGWHTKAILMKYPDIHVIWIDQDINNLNSAKANLADFGDRITFIQDNFSNISLIDRQVDWILLDLWLASTHIDQEERGFSYQKSAPLDMRMNLWNHLTAEHVINTFKEKTLADIFYRYWEEPKSYAIAKAICKQREKQPITDSIQLVDIIKSVKVDRYKHPARLVFQALRIYVNDELNTLQLWLQWSLKVLKKWGIMAIISYHSIEDRIVKDFFRLSRSDCVCPKEILLCQCNKQKELEIITKKPIIPTDKEITDNPRSRSAHLRVAKKIC